MKKVKKSKKPVAKIYKRRVKGLSEKMIQNFLARIAAI